MFVASRVYKYATGTPGASSSNAGPSSSRPPPANPSDQRVKRNPKKRPSGPRAAGKHGILSPDEHGTLPTSPPPSYASVASGSATSVASGTGANGSTKTPAALARDAERVALIDRILEMESLYEVLGIKRNAKPDEIRRGFLARSRVVHPDKMPDYAPCIPAFQKLSFAYQTLSNPTSRRMYDVSGRSDLAAAVAAGRSPGGAGGDGAGFDGAYGGDETLNGVLYNVFCEFLEGDFEMIRVLINAMNEGNSGMNLGDEAIDSIEGVFRRIREALLAGKKYLAIVRFELMRLYEIQHSLRQLSYFDVFGRLRLTLQLARVTISIPMRVDLAMKDEEGEGGEGAKDGNGQAARERGSEDEGDSDTAPSDTDDEEESEGSDAQGPDAASKRTASGAHRRRKAAQGDFGVAQEDTEDEDEEASAERAEGQRRERRRLRRRERRARAREAKRRARARVAGATGDGEEDDEEEDDEEEEVEEGEDTRHGKRDGETNVKSDSPSSAEAKGSGRNRRRHRSSRGASHSTSQQQTTPQQGKGGRESKALQRKGLLGPTATALLNGVVKVLETSENWVPGKRNEVED